MLPALDVPQAAAEPTNVNNGHTVQVNLPAGQTLTAGDKQATRSERTCPLPAPDGRLIKHSM